MAVEPLRQLNVADVVAMAARYMAERGMPASEAVGRILAEHTLDSRAADYFVRKGMISAINNVHAVARAEPRVVEHREDDLSPGPEAPRARTTYRDFLRFQPRWAHGRDLESALAMMFQGVNGRMTPLWDFTQEDWRHMLQHEIGQAKGHARKARVAQDAMRTLVRFDVPTARELPAGAMKSLETAVEEAWRG